MGPVGHVKRCRLPTTNHQPPTTNHQPPSTNYQLPTTNYQLPTTHYQPPTTNYQLRRSFPHHLLDRRVPLHDLEPGIHAQRQHAFLDRRVAQLRCAAVLHDAATQRWRHHHDFVHASAPLHAGSIAGIAALSAEITELAELGVERQVVKE